MEHQMPPRDTFADSEEAEFVSSAPSQPLNGDGKKLHVTRIVLGAPPWLSSSFLRKSKAPFLHTFQVQSPSYSAVTKGATEMQLQR